MKRLKLRNSRKTALVDDHWFHFLSLFPWRLDCYGYPCFGKFMEGRCRTFYMHKIVCGEYATKKHIDHRDRNTLNNQKSNLRLVSVSENIQNQRRKKKAKSGFRGVRKISKGSNYQARIFLHGKEVSIGCFRSAKEASRAYEKFRKAHII